MNFLFLTFLKVFQSFNWEKQATLPNEFKSSENLQKLALLNQRRISEDKTFINKTNTLSNVVNPNLNIGYDKL